MHTHHVWEEPARATLELIEDLCEAEVCAFNLVFDWWHVVKLYNTLRLLPSGRPPTLRGWWGVSREAIRGPCLRPRAALDLMLHGRKGPAQTLMARDDVYLRRVPVALAQALADELTQRVNLPNIYFARRKDGARWKVQADPAFPDVYLTFGAAGGLKPLVQHLLGLEVLDFPIPKGLRPKGEVPWDPHVSKPYPPELFYQHVTFWKMNEAARRYAEEDVRHLRRLRRHWGNPPAGDTDSELTVCVANARFRGFAVSREAAQLQLRKERQLIVDYPDHARHAKVLQELRAACDSDVERLAIEDTKRETLNVLVKWGQQHPAAALAQRVKAARSAAKRRDVLLKVLQAGRAHWDYKVTGTLSNRMAGAGRFNATGIAKGETRDLFVFKDDQLPHLDGGDFSGFEAAIAVAVYGDEELERQLRAGRKIGPLFGELFYDADHDAIKESSVNATNQVKLLNRDGTLMGREGDVYGPSKNMFYGYIYGAMEHKLSETGNLSLEQTERGFATLATRFPKVHAGRKADQDAFCSMRQPGGLGTRVVWHEPKDHVESLLGHKRFYTLENELCRTLFHLAQSPPETLKGCRVRVLRREHKGYQTASGAVQSALYAAAFQIQARNMRSAGNHRIQATGAEITKDLQKEIWDLQPTGIHPWVVQPMNVHDEVVVPHSGVDTTCAVGTVLERFRPVVQLLDIDWRTGLRSWGDLR